MADDSKNGLSQKIIEIVREKKPETTADLVSLAKQELQHSEQEILETTIRLYNTGTLKVTKKPASAPPRLSTYLRTAQPFWFWLTAATTIITAIIVLTIPDGLHPYVYARYALGSIFVLWLPGYTFTRALFPQEPRIDSSQESLDPTERIAISIGLSLSITVIVGLLLNCTPWGITLASTMLGLIALTLISATVAVAREYSIQTRALDL